MGCTPSQSSTCILVGQRNSPSTEDVRKSTHDSKEALLGDSPFKKKYFLEEDIDSQNGDDLQESIASHKSELSSKSNSGSWDSGVYELEDDYSHVITENSDAGKVKEVDSQFEPREDLELILEGKACPTRLSARDRDFKEQQAILELLRKEGLIVRPPAKAVGGIKFELLSTEHAPTNDSSLTRKLPPLNMRRKQKQRKSELTREEIQQKLIKAEERRKKRTEEKLGKMATKDLLELQTIAQQQAEINRQKIEKKLQASTQSREKHLTEVQEKLKAREEHAKQVRERKLMLACGFKYISPPGTD